MNKFSKFALLSVVALQVAVSSVVAVSTPASLTVSGTIAATETSSFTTAGTPLDLTSTLTNADANSNRGTLTVASNGARGRDLSVSAANKYSMKHTTSTATPTPAVPYTLTLIKASGTLPTKVFAASSGTFSAANDVTTAMGNATGQSLSGGTTSPAGIVSAAGLTVFFFRENANNTTPIAAPVNLTYTTKVAYTGVTGLAAGTYSDTVTFTVTNAD